MNPAARSQLWLATLGAVVALGAAAIPATIQLFDEDSPPTAATPVENGATPPVSPSRTTVAEPTGNGQRDGGSGRSGRRSGRANDEP